MPLSEQFKAFWARFSSKKRKRKTESSSIFLRFLEESRSISVLVFALTVLSIGLISFLGVKQTSFQFLAGQEATIRIVAAEDFSYQSDILTT
ncbi:MAG: hypothetical protein AAGB46_11265, partial [Verrucomicrobiota bacterium]